MAKSRLFVSYSRNDSFAARKLFQSFEKMDIDVWADWENTPSTVDWMDQIFRGIEGADAFIFLVRPDSAISEVCNVEISHAAKKNKRIIPVVVHNVDRRKIKVTRIPQADIVTSLAFSGNTDTLMTTSSNVLQLWDISILQKIESGQIVETTCSRLLRNFDATQRVVFFRDENYPLLWEELP